MARIEQRGKDPAWSTVQRLARALGVGVAEFEAGEDELPTRQGRPRKPPPGPAGRKGRKPKAR